MLIKPNTITRRLLTIAATVAMSAVPSVMSATETAGPDSRLVSRTVTRTTPEGMTETVTETYAEDNTSGRRDFDIRPVGRILLDGAAYISHDKSFVDGVGVPDIRAGVSMKYGMWSALIDLGYAYDKFSLKDVYIEAKFNLSMRLRVGYFIHQFSLQSATGSSMKVSMEEPTSNEVFNYPRQLGVMFVYDKGQYFGTFSAHTVGGLAMKNHTNDLGRCRFGFLTRQVWRPYTDGALILQAGISGAYDNPKADNEFTLSANFPTRVSSVQALCAVLPETRHIYRFTPELLLASGRVALEAQYYWLYADRRGDLEGYNAYGAYSLLRGLICGGSYSYSHSSASLSTPAPKSLEGVLGYNYTNLSDSKTGIRGGRINDVSATLNWYINKFIIWRLRYSYTHRWDCAANPTVDLGTFQTRFQIIF